MRLASITDFGAGFICINPCTVLRAFRFAEYEPQPLRFAIFASFPSYVVLHDSDILAVRKKENNSFYGALRVLYLVFIKMCHRIDLLSLHS